MSGIYIPGMAMPKSCPCELIGIGYDLSCSFAGGVPARVKEYYECCQNDTRPSWCPLVPVPPHGRLIDADKLDYSNTDLLGNHIVYMVDIEDAPTIIPADKEETE